MAEIVLKGLGKEYEKGTPVIEDLNLTIHDGEFLVLVGPSGCGKSTTLRLIAGLESATAGEIYIGDRLVNDIPPKDRDISMVFQNYALYPHMTVYDNMAFGLKLRKFKKPEIRERVGEAAEILEIQDLLKRKPKQLSGGQRQRVALGRAIVRKPKVFLFDEPLSNLDAKLRVQMRTEIKKLHQTLGITMVYVTHDQVEAMTMGDRISVMKDGIIHQVDNPLNLYNHPVDLFVAGFIGSPAMNFMPASVLNGDEFVAEEGAVRLPIPEKRRKSMQPYTGKPVMIGIRPEDIYLNRPSSEAAEISMKMEVYEPMGNESYVHLTTGKTKIICRTQELITARPGDSMPFYLNLQKAHYFDQSSGMGIQ